MDEWQQNLQRSITEFTQIVGIRSQEELDDAVKYFCENGGAVLINDHALQWIAVGQPSSLVQNQFVQVWMENVIQRQPNSEMLSAITTNPPLSSTSSARRQEQASEQPINPPKPMYDIPENAIRSLNLAKSQLDEMECTNERNNRESPKMPMSKPVSYGDISPKSNIEKNIAEKQEDRFTSPTTALSNNAANTNYNVVQALTIHQQQNETSAFVIPTFSKNRKAASLAGTVNSINMPMTEQCTINSEDVTSRHQMPEKYGLLNIDLTCCTREITSRRSMNETAPSHNKRAAMTTPTKRSKYRNDYGSDSEDSNTETSDYSSVSPKKARVNSARRIDQIGATLLSSAKNHFLTPMVPYFVTSFKLALEKAMSHPIYMFEALCDLLPTLEDMHEEAMRPDDDGASIMCRVLKLDKHHNAKTRISNMLKRYWIEWIIREKLDDNSDEERFSSYRYSRHGDRELLYAIVGLIPSPVMCFCEFPFSIATIVHNTNDRQNGFACLKRELDEILAKLDTSVREMLWHQDRTIKNYLLKRINEFNQESNN